MLTSFGRFCRKLRIDKGEILHDMAGKLSVSAAFLSKVENGKGRPPEEWIHLIPSLYNLSKAEEKKLLNLIFEARNFENIGMGQFSSDKREGVICEI